MAMALVLIFATLAACSRGEPAEGSPDQMPQTGSLQPVMPEQVRVVYRRSCESCHGIDARGITGIAPPLVGSKKRTAEEWDKYLRAPGTVHPAGNMPPVWMLDDEIKLMAEYLAGARE